MSEWVDYTKTPPVRVLEERSTDGELVCPKCGKLNQDLWEYEDGTCDVECDECGVRLGLTIDVSNCGPLLNCPACGVWLELTAERRTLYTLLHPEEFHG